MYYSMLNFAASRPSDSQVSSQLTFKPLVGLNEESGISQPCHWPWDGNDQFQRHACTRERGHWGEGQLMY